MTDLPTQFTDHELDAPILGPAGGRLVGRDGAPLAVALGQTAGRGATPRFTSARLTLSARSCPSFRLKKSSPVLSVCPWISTFLISGCSLSARAISSTSCSLLGRMLSDPEANWILPKITILPVAHRDPRLVGTAVAIAARLLGVLGAFVVVVGDAVVVVVGLRAAVAVLEPVAVLRLGGAPVLAVDDAVAVAVALPAPARATRTRSARPRARRKSGTASPLVIPTPPMP